jgi:hypothetical protein
VPDKKVSVLIGYIVMLQMKATALHAKSRNKNLYSKEVFSLTCHLYSSLVIIDTLTHLHNASGCQTLAMKYLLDFELKIIIGRSFL